MRFYEISRAAFRPAILASLVALAALSVLPALPFRGAALLLGQDWYRWLLLSLWVLAGMLMLAAPWLWPLGRRGQPGRLGQLSWLSRYLVLHFPLLFCLFFAGLSLAFDQRFELAIREGQVLDLKPLLAEHGLPLRNEQRLGLEGFTVEQGEGRRARQTFRSDLVLNGEPRILAVNQPLRLEAYQLYQMDWRLFVRGIEFLVAGRSLPLQELSRDGLELRDGSRLFVAPERQDGDGILYRWLWLAADGNGRSEGNFGSAAARQGLDLRPSGLLRVPLELVVEDYGYTSVLLLTWKPFRLPLFASGLVYLFSLLGLYLPRRRRGEAL